MALFNYTTKEITIKVVYYGPGLSGKTTNLQYLHYVLDPDRKSKLVSLPTETDRTLFFDLLPVDLGKIRDFFIRFQLYTVPGQVRYNATRKLVLKGADAVVFVADSQRELKEQNIESFKNMRENLIANNIDPDKIPVLLQYNKRDLPNILSVEELNEDLNENGKYGYLEATAIDGAGVEESFRHITTLVIDEIEKRQKIKLFPIEEAVKATEEKEAPVGVGIGEPIDEEPMTPKPVIESSMYEPPEIGKRKYIIPDLEEEPAQTAIGEKSPLPEEVTIKKTVEVTPFVVEKLDMIIDNIKEILYALKEINNVIKETIVEQRKINVQLRDISKNFEQIKTKKRWFRFS